MAAITQFSELKTQIANFLHDSTLTADIPLFVQLAEDRIAQDLRIRAMETRKDLIVAATVDGDTVGGTANAITLTPATAATSYALGDTYKFTVGTTNTGAATVDISGLGAQNIKKYLEGAKADVAAGDLIAGTDARLYYDGTDFISVPQGGVPLPTDFLQERRLYIDGDRKRLTYYPTDQFWVTNATNESNRPTFYTIEGDILVVGPVPDTAATLRLLYYKRFASLSADADVNWIITNAVGLLLYGSLMEASLYKNDAVNAQKWGILYDQIKSRVEKADRKARYPEGALSARPDVGVI